MTETQERVQVVKSLLDGAMTARRRGEPERVIRLCEDVLAMLEPADRRFHRIANMDLGAVYLTQLIDYAKAEDHFRRVVELEPENQWASVGLFSAVFWQGRLAEGLQEIMRFATTYDAPEYREMLSDACVEAMPERVRALAREAQELVRRGAGSPSEDGSG